MSFYITISKNFSTRERVVVVVANNAENLTDILTIRLKFDFLLWEIYVCKAASYKFSYFSRIIFL